MGFDFISGLGSVVDCLDLSPGVNPLGVTGGLPLLSLTALVEAVSFSTVLV